MIEELKEFLMGRKSSTVADHYGIKQEEVDRLITEMLCDIIKANNKSEILDKYFPTLDGMGRMKVEIYALAREKAKKLND